jgi:outer membrane protein W
MKKLAISIFILITIFTSYPQTRLSVGLGYDVSFPTGKFGDMVKTGSNWSLFAEYPLSDNLSIQLITGYMVMPVDIDPIGYVGQVITFDFKSIPVKTALKYFLTDNLFLQGELGAGFVRVTVTGTDYNANKTTESTEYKARFTCGAGLGTLFHLSPQSQINLTAKYIYLNSGYSFGFNHILLGMGLVVHFDI